MPKVMFGKPGVNYGVNGVVYTPDSSGLLQGVADNDVSALVGSGTILLMGDGGFTLSSTAGELVATGTTVDDALQLFAQHNVITGATPGSGVILPESGSVGSLLIIAVNLSDYVLKVYSLSDMVDGLSLGIPSFLPNGCTGFYFSSGDGKQISAVMADPRRRGTGGAFNLIGRLLAADMNSVDSQPIQMLVDINSRFRIKQITAVNASVMLDIAVGGIYTDQSMAGTALVADSQTYSSLSSPDTVMDLTMVPATRNMLWPGDTPLYLTLSTPQGDPETAVPATADFYVYGSN